MDPQIVSQALKIGESTLSYEQKTLAIWSLFQEQKKKLTGEHKKKVSFILPDERRHQGKEETILLSKSTKDD
jgi:hypothetical protein